MFSRALPSAALALLASQLVSAQTSTLCDPTKKKCADDSALGSSITVDFTKGKNDFFTMAEGTTLDYDPANGAVFTIKEESNAPTVTSNKYIFFGKVDVTLKASQGQGIVTSFVLQSDDLDEIDWEWLGGDTAQVQTNYFGKGDTTTYDRGTYEKVANPQDNFVTYTIDWTKDYVRWYIAGNMVRELKYSDAKGGTRFPQTPMQIKLGTWCAGGKNNAEGTVQWAGGYTDFSKGPFNGYYKSITIKDYSNGVTGAKSYSYNDGSDGSYQSIKISTDGGDVSASSGSSSSGSSKTDSPSSTQSGGSTTLATVTGAGGLTQATNGADVSGTGSVVPSSTIAVPSVSGANTSAATAKPTGTSTGSAASSSSSAPAKSGAFKQGCNVVLLGASVLLGFLVL